MLWISSIVAASAALAQSTPTVLDPQYTIRLAATGLGAGNHMTADRAGNLYVLDYRNFEPGKITVLAPDGTLSTIPTGIPFTDGIAALPDGNLLVSDDRVVHHVTPSGTVTLYLDTISNPGQFEYTFVPAGRAAWKQDLYVPEPNPGRIFRLHPDKSWEVFASGLNNPQAPTFDDRGHLWVPEYSGQLVELDENGLVVQRIGGLENHKPIGVEFWQGSLFATSPYAASLVRVERDGTWQVFAVGFTGIVHPPFNGPTGAVAIGSCLYVSDADNLWCIEPVAPTLQAVSPPRGAYDGSHSVTVTGTGFTLWPVMDVRFGADHVSNVVVVNDQTLTCDVPASAPGPVDVTLTTDLGTTVLPEAFSYTPALLLEGPGTLGSNVVLRHLCDPGDEVMGIYGPPPAVDLVTPPFGGSLCIDPFLVLFQSPGWPFDELVVGFTVPYDPAFVGTQLLFQALVGPSLSGPVPDGAWTNCSLLTIQ